MNVNLFGCCSFVVGLVSHKGEIMKAYICSSFLL